MNRKNDVLVARRLTLTLLVLVALLSLSARAHAAEPVTLDWAAPNMCPTHDDVLAEVSRLLGGQVEADTPLTARAVITHVPSSGYRLEIALERSLSERPRYVRALTCAELGDAAALILALAIDPAAVVGVPDRPALVAPPHPVGAWPPPSSPAPPATVEPAPDAPGEPLAGPTVRGSPPPAPFTYRAPFVAPWVMRTRVEPLRSPPRLVRAFVAIFADAGTFRNVAPMLRAGASITPSATAPLHLEAAAVILWGGRIPMFESPTKGGEFWLAGGALAACYEARLKRQGPSSLAVGACAGVEAGAMLGTSYGVTSTENGAAPWMAPVGSGRMRWTFAPRLSLRIEVSLAVPLLRPVFQVEGLGVIHHTGIVAGRAGAGIEIDFAGP